MSHALAQIRALARAFLARFFDSEITNGADDMRQSFFWLMAALAMPGLFIPWIMVFDWNLIGMIHGYEILRIASRAEKAFYLGLSMLSAGALTAIAWSSLLPDRRDTLILGAMPVRPRVVVTGKLVALGAYVGIVAIGMHGIGAFFWGSILGTNGPMRFMVMSVVAHFIASTAISVTTCLAIAAAQGLVLAIAGPRMFRPLSTLLQVTVVGLLAVFLALLPAMTSAAPHTIGGGVRAEPWMLSLPPLWFLGLYEWILGTTDPLLIELAGRAAIAVGVSAGLTLLTFPLAYRRLMVSVVESESEGQRALTRAARAVMVRAAGRHPAVRATADFFVVTLGRVERQRFVLATALGLALAWSLPGLRSYTASGEPQAPMLALPLAAMMFLLVGFRAASSLPSDVRASWLFEVLDLPRRHARQALERVMFLLAVLPPVIVSTPIYWYLWGSSVAVTHALVMTAVGVALLELLIWHCNGMPCGQQWVPARIGFGRRWPVHFALFLIVVVGVPRLEVVLFQTTYGAAAFVILLVVLAVAVRIASGRHQIVPSYDDVDPVAGVLRIN